MEREEHWQSEDVSGKKEKHSRRKKALSQRGHEGLMRGSPIYPFCQTPKWKGQCNWLLTDKPHTTYKRMKKLLEGQVKKSTLNSALVLFSSMTQLLISCPDLCPRARGSPAAIPQGSAATCSGSSDPSFFFPNMPCMDHAVSIQLLPGTRMFIWLQGSAPTPEPCSLVQDLQARNQPEALPREYSAPQTTPKVQFLSPTGNPSKAQTPK